MIDVLMMNERVINSSCHPAGNLLKNGRKCFQGDGHAPPSIAMTLYFGIGWQSSKRQQENFEGEKKVDSRLDIRIKQSRRDDMIIDDDMIVDMDAQ